MVVQEKEYVQWPKLMKTDRKKKDPTSIVNSTGPTDMKPIIAINCYMRSQIKRGHLKNFVRKAEELRVQLENAEVAVRK